MSKAGTPRPDPTVIGDVAAPPFVRLPDPLALFAVRARRFRTLADGHELAPYLRFLAALSDCQHRLQGGLPEPDMPAADARVRAHDHGMPPLDRSRFTADAALDRTLDLLFTLAAEIDMPATARAALARVRAADAVLRDGMVRSVLAIPSQSRRWPITSMSRRRCRCTLSAWRRGSMRLHWCRLAMGPARSAAAHPSPRQSSAGLARMASASAPARCARRCGTQFESNACCAALPRASPIRSSTPALPMSRRKPAKAAAAM